MTLSLLAVLLPLDLPAETVEATELADAAEPVEKVDDVTDGLLLDFCEMLLSCLLDATESFRDELVRFARRDFFADFEPCDDEYFELFVDFVEYPLDGAVDLVDFEDFVKVPVFREVEGVEDVAPELRLALELLKLPAVEYELPVDLLTDWSRLLVDPRLAEWLPRPP